jgi:TolB protein
VAWEYRTDRPDVDHFNRDYQPELARGGSEICRLEPRGGRVERLTRSDPPVWDFRACESPDGRRIAFCRAATGEVPSLWTMDSGGGEPRAISRGIDGKGADHPRWLPSRS